MNGVLTDVHLSDHTWDIAEQKQLQAGWQFEYRFTDSFSFRQNFRYSDINLHQRYMFSMGVDPVAQVAYRGRGQKEQDLKSVIIDTQVLYSLETGGISHKFLAGFDYSDSDDEWAVDLNLGGGTYIDNVLSLTNPVYGLSYSDPDPLAVSEEGENQKGIYFQDQIEFNKLILTLGGRFDSAETFVNTDYIPFPNPIRATVEGDEFTYRVAATYLFDNGLAPYASYSTSFQLVSGADINGNPFEPSKGKQFELGVKYQPASFPGFMTLSLFDLELTNVLTTDPTNPFYEVQTGKVKAKGLEAEVSASPVDGLDMMVAYSYLDTDIVSNGADNGFSRQLQPGHTITVFGDYTVQEGSLEGFGLGGGMRYQSKSFASVDNSLTNASTFLVDAQMHYSFGNWRLGLNATNLFDKKTFSCNNTVSCAPGYRRTVLASLRYRY